MRNTMIKGIFAAFTIMLASTLVAQQHRGGNGPGRGLGIDMSTTFRVQGEVVSFQAGFGLGTPELTLREANGTVSSFVLGPFHYLQSKGFTAQPGERAEISGWICTGCEHGVAVAQVKNLTTGLVLVLRNADGTPAWIGGAGRGTGGQANPDQPRAGRGNGQGARGGQGFGNGHGLGRNHANSQGLCGGVGPDLEKVTTYKGEVKSFTGGLGDGYPTLVLATASGEVSILLSPYRALIQAGYTPTVGAQLEVLAAPVMQNQKEYWVALTLTDLASGLKLVLRDAETGFPLVVGHGCRR